MTEKNLDSIQQANQDITRITSALSAVKNLDSLVLPNGARRESPPLNDMRHITQVFEELKATFFEKQAEYKGASPDVFRNFTQGGILQNETPEQTLLGYVDKQIVSLFDAKHTNPERLSDPAFVTEKAKDIAVYMIILIAMVRSKK
jgi:hypothetical protein